jgi:uncharacterized lipoprotein YmbA
MKKLLPILALFLLTACESKKYYTLGNTLNITPTVNYTKEIDVVKINVPKYLRDHTLVRQVTPYQVEIIDKAQWLTPMQKRLTNVLIDYLQKSMNNPNVHLYPWNSGQKTAKRVTVTIKRFIAYKTEVVLEANYKIQDFEKKTTETKLFKSSVETNENIDNMMASMEKAYFELAEKIKEEVVK